MPKVPATTPSANEILKTLQVPPAQGIVVFSASSLAARDKIVVTS